MSALAAETTTSVLIVGGGVSGLTASLLLSRLDVPHVLVERHPRTALLPKAHIINQRAMEIFREIGVDGDIYEHGCPPENMSTIAWMTSLAGPTPLHGRRIARADAWCGGPAYASASPCRPTNLPQLRLEPLLRRRAEDRAPATVLFNHEMHSLAQTTDGVEAEIEDREHATRHAVRARYVIAADGGRTLGPALGVEMAGERGLLDMVSTHFSADLSAYWQDDSVVICFSTNPDGEGSLGSGVLLPMGPGTWGKSSKEWQYHSALHTGDPDAFDTPLMLSRMREMLGRPDLDAEIHSLSRWRFEAVVADKYRAGRCFFAGDAAHRHPPNGGLGLNTAVADVHNLAWKLALVLRGHANEALLDTYEQERRPVGQAVVARALRNWRAHIDIDAAMGLADAADRTEAWARTEELFSDTPAGELRRASVDRAVAAAAPEFTGQDIELGYRYAGEAIVAGGAALGQDPRPGDGGYAASTDPGRAMPHAWLTSRTSQERTSTLDLVSGTRFGLLVDTAASAWSGGLAAAVGELGLPASLVGVISIGDVGSGAEWWDIDQTWSRLRGVSPTGAVLVRPDRHVAWRANTVPADPASELTYALAWAILI